MEKSSANVTVDVETHSSTSLGPLPAEDSNNGEEPPPDIPNAGSSCEGVKDTSLDGARTTNATSSLSNISIDIDVENIASYAHTTSAEKIAQILDTNIELV